jgi:hypothetical protein
MTPERIKELRASAADCSWACAPEELTECLDEIERRHTSEEMIEQCQLATVRANKRAAEKVRAWGSLIFWEDSRAKDDLMNLADEIEKGET